MTIKNHPKLYVGANPVLVILYGAVALGKSTTAAEAQDAVLLNASQGLRYVDATIPRWNMESLSDLGEFNAFAKQRDSGVKAVVFDGFDAFVQRHLSGAGEVSADHLTMQRKTLPVLEAFLMLPVHRILVMNEHLKYAKLGSSDYRITFDIDPRLTEILMNRADFVLRVVPSQERGESILQFDGSHAPKFEYKVRNRKHFYDAQGKPRVVPLSALLPVVGIARRSTGENIEKAETTENHEPTKPTPDSTPNPTGSA